MRLVVLCLSVLFLLSGCFLAPFIGAFKDSGATQGDRERLLSLDVKRFTEAMSWGSAGPILAFVDESAQKQVQEQLNEKADTERVVESKISNVDFANDSFDANVLVKVKYYRIPYYIVQERKENLGWKFTLGSGWRLMSREVG